MSFSLHQFLLYWKGSEVEVVRADKQPFMTVTSFVKARYYRKEFSSIKFTRRRKDGVPRKTYMDLKGFVEIQKMAAKLLNVTTIVPYRSISGPIIEEIDDD